MASAAKRNFAKGHRTVVYYHTMAQREACYFEPSADRGFSLVSNTSILEVPPRRIS